EDFAMYATTGMRRRVGWLMAVAVLILALALGACAGRGGRGAQTNGVSGGNPPAQQTTTGGQTSNSNPAAAAMAAADDQMQSLLSALDAAQHEASTDLSLQDVETQP